MTIAEDWLAALPENAKSAEYRAHLLQGVRDRIVTCDWLPIISRARGRTCVIHVVDDALRVTRADGSRFRPQFSAELLQQTADILGASLPTSMVMDLAWEQSIQPPIFGPTLNPDRLLTADERAYVEKIGVLETGKAFDLMSTKRWSLAWNDLVEQRRVGRSGIVRCAGKGWILSPLLGQRAPGKIAVNYGLYAKPPTHSWGPFLSHSGLVMWQTRGTRHGPEHLDETQTGQLVASIVAVDGIAMNFADVLTSGELWELVSDEGPQTPRRQPGVAPLDFVPAPGA